jgi:hypothetical protein
MRCPRCRKWEAVYEVVADDGAVVQTCAACLTPQERRGIDNDRAMARMEGKP